MIGCSIGIMAYNEEENIRSLLDSILVQNLTFCVIWEIVIVSSGSTDKTNEIIEDFARKDPRIRLIIQTERLGKASAINLFLKNVKPGVCVLVNSDSILDTDAVEFLVKPFDKPDIGMAGGRPIPFYHPNCFMRSVNNFMWDLHHEISLRSPKMGELIAFRNNIVQRIIEDTAVDEFCIEWLIKNSGYKIVYILESNVYIRTPATVRDFISQRRRIAIGHLWAEQVLEYSPSTRNIWLTLRLTFEQLIRNPQTSISVLTAVFFEGLSRILGWYDYYIRQRNPYIWEICLSTKSKPKYF